MNVRPIDIEPIESNGADCAVPIGPGVSLALAEYNALLAALRTSNTVQAMAASFAEEIAEGEALRRAETGDNVIAFPVRVEEPEEFELQIAA